MEGVNLKLVDLDYREHLLAWLIRAVKAEKGKGKHIKPVFTKFKQFYDYKAEITKASKKKMEKSKYPGIGKLLSKGD